MATPNPFGDPQTMALMGLAQGLLSAGGPHPMPVGLGGALAQGVGGALSGAQSAQIYQNQDLRNTGLRTALEAQGRQQEAINALASTLPPEKRTLFLADPASYIKTLTGINKVGPGERLFMGQNEVAAVPPNAHFQDTGGTIQGLNPATGEPVGPAIPKTLTPEATNITPYQGAQLQIQAANADPLGMLGLRDIVNRYVSAPVKGGATMPSVTPRPLGPSAPQLGAIPSDVHGEDFLGRVPKPIADQVKALAEGRMQFPAGFALKSPYWQNMISMVSQYDPNFDAVNYNARANTRKDFTSGKSADNITALNTAIYHLGSLEKNLSALNNSSIPAFNTVKNTLGEQLGSESIQQAKKASEADAEAVSHELAKVFRSVGMSEGEVNSWKQKITTNSSPAQRKAIIGEALHLMEGRLEALGERYNRGLGTTAEPLSLLDPKARAVYQQLKQASGEAVPQGGIKFLGFEK